MIDYIVTQNDDVIAKYRQEKEPEPPEGVVKKVDDADDIKLDNPANWFYS